MSAFIFTATTEHDCQRKGCPLGGKIKVGQKGVKTKGVVARGCSTTEYGSVYYHEECWPGGRKGAK